jgi:hypothetical protein
LLYVFAAASILAIGLYEQLPRAAFEAQREKEALIIHHGEQYKRGVQLYVRKFGRYPAKMEDLDNTQNIRFLRKHYIDPMTGKEEWRLLHMGPNGKLIDSKIKKVDPNADQWHQGSITEFKSASTASDDGETLNANIATRKRPSDDQMQQPMQGATGNTVITDPTQLASMAAAGITPGAPGGASSPTDPNAPATPKPASWLNGGALPGLPPGQRGLTLPQPVQTAPNAGAGGSTGDQGSSVSGNGGYGSGPAAFSTVTPLGPGQAGQPGQQGYNTAPGSNNQLGNGNGFGQPGAQSSASNMINNLLTQPRPGGAPSGIPGTNSMGGVVGGGLAGVASTYRGKGIKTYNDQDEYNKWEFYYDLGAEQAAAVQNQMNQMNQKPAQSTFGQTQSSQPPAFGQQGTVGGVSQSTFGSQQATPSQ